MISVTYCGQFTNYIGYQNMISLAVGCCYNRFLRVTKTLVVMLSHPMQKSRCTNTKDDGVYLSSSEIVTKKRVNERRGLQMSQMSCGYSNASAKIFLHRQYVFNRARFIEPRLNLTSITRRQGMCQAHYQIADVVFKNTTMLEADWFHKIA